MALETEIQPTTETPVTPAVAGPSFKERVSALSGPALDHWKMEGDIDGAEALMTPNTEIDVTPASSPGTSETPETAVESEAASEPAHEEPKAGETPEQKSERKKRNDARRLRDAHKIEVELATERTKREFLEKQLAESKAASAPAPEKKPIVDPSKPKRPRLDQFDNVAAYEAALDAYDDARDAYNATSLEQREAQRTAQSQFQTAADKWETLKTAGRAKFNDFDAVAFNAKVPASHVGIVELQSRNDGPELMYHLGKHPDIAAKFADATDIPGFQTYAELTARAAKDPAFALILGEKRGIAKAELARISEGLSKPKTPPLKETIARQPKPSGEVAVEAHGGPVEDELEDAVRRKDMRAYTRIMNKRELQDAGA